MGVKCLAQEHNTVPQPRLEPGPFDPESSALTIKPPRIPHNKLLKNAFLQCMEVSVLFTISYLPTCNLIINALKKKSF